MIPTPTPFIYNAVVTSVHDGDTVTITVDLGFNTHIVGMDVRLNGLNAPELSTPEGKKLSILLREKLINKQVVVATQKDKREKYGRMLADIWCGGQHINEWLVAAGLAKAWDGRGARPV